jgi:hypothetical protein
LDEQLFQDHLQLGVLQEHLVQTFEAPGTTAQRAVRIRVTLVPWNHRLFRLDEPLCLQAGRACQDVESTDMTYEPGDMTYELVDMRYELGDRMNERIFQKAKPLVNPHPDRARSTTSTEERANPHGTPSDPDSSTLIAGLPPSRSRCARPQHSGASPATACAWCAHHGNATPLACRIAACPALGFADAVYADMGRAVARLGTRPPGTRVR